jgi:DNA-binding transcriptional MerR regulator
VDGFTTQKVAELTGVNRKTLHYWDRSGFLSPSLAQAHGTGSRRLYSFQDVVAVRVGHQLRSQGISLQGLRRVVRFLQNQKGADCPLAERYLVTDGRDVYVTKGGGVESVLRQPGQGSLLFVVDLTQIVGNLGDTVATLRKAAELLSAEEAGPKKKRERARTSKREPAAGKPRIAT